MCVLLISSQEGVSDFRSYPAGLLGVISYIKRRYNNPPIYITETGIFHTSCCKIFILSNKDLIVKNNAIFQQGLLILTTAQLRLNGY